MTDGNNTKNIEFLDKHRDILLELFPQGVVALDLETTGLSPLIDKIIELSAIKVTPEGLEFYDELVNPMISIPQFTIDIHGITDDMVLGKRCIEEVQRDFMEFLGDLPIIAHNAKFDLGFIVFNLHQDAADFSKSDVFCSCKLSRYALSDMPNHKLGTLVKELGIPLDNHHRALDDAVACLKVFAEACISLKKDDHLNAFKQGYLFNMNEFSTLNEFDIPENLKGLEKCLENQDIVEIKYRGGSMKNQYRPVRPISFLPVPQGNILYAHCLTSDLYKSFSLKKITDFRELKASEVEELRENLKRMKEQP